MQTLESKLVVTPPNLEPTVKSFNVLQEEIRQAKKELNGLTKDTTEFTNKTKEIGALNNELNDLKGTISNLSGSPMENLNGSFGLLTNQIKNLDIDGATSSFNTLWSTILANPLIAVSSAVFLLYQNWDKVLDVFKFLTPAVKDNTFAINEQKRALDEAAKSQDIYIQKLNDQLELLSLTNAPLAEILNVIKTKTKAEVSSIDEQIAKVKEQIKVYDDLRLSRQLQGLTSANLNAEEVSAQEIYLRQRLEQLNAFAVKRDLIIENGAKAEKDIIKEKQDAYKKADEETRKFYDELLEIDRLYWETLGDAERSRNEAKLIQADIFKKRELEDKAIKLQNEIEEDERQQEAAALQAKLREDSYNFRKDLDKKELDDAKKLQEEKNKAAVEGQKVLNQSLLGLSTLLYQSRAKNAEKGSAAEQEAAKKAFELEKGINVSIAVVNGIQATLAAFAAGSKFGPIVGAAYAAAAGVVSLASIAKIKAAQFTPSSNASPPSPNEPAPQVIIPEETITPTAPLVTPTTNLNQDGTINTGSNELTVSEGEISNVQRRVQVLEGRASF